MRRPIRTHLINRSNRPVNRSNRPVYRSKPVTHAILNLDLNSNRSNRPVNWTNRSVYRYETVELSFLNSNSNLTGFSNRSGLLEPECSGLGCPVGKKTLPVVATKIHGSAAQFPIGPTRRRAGRASRVTGSPPLPSRSSHRPSRLPSPKTRRRLRRHAHAVIEHTHSSRDRAPLPWLPPAAV